MQTEKNRQLIEALLHERELLNELNKCKDQIAELLKGKAAPPKCKVRPGKIFTSSQLSREFCRVCMN